MKTKTRILLKGLNASGCIVLGLSNITGLSIVRSIGKKGIPVIGIDSSKFTLGTFSKYCSSMETADNDASLLCLLEEMGKISTHKNVIFCESDKYLLFVDRNRKHLEKYFYLSLPEKFSLQYIINKKNMVKLSRKAGLNIPLTFFSDESSLDEIRDKLKYPSIIKPLYTQEGYRTKVEVLNDEQYLYEAIKQDRFTDGYIIQEVVEGSENNIWICGGYCDRNSRPIVLFTARKYRQIPKFFGSTTLGISQQNKAVTTQAVAFLKYIGHHGCFCFEVKQCKDKAEYKFIEVNLRMAFWNEMAISAGIDLAYISYCDTIGLAKQQNLRQKDGILWISILDDFISCVKYYSKDNKFILVDWIKNAFKADSYAVFRFTDIKPFIFKIISHSLRMNQRKRLHKNENTI